MVPGSSSGLDSAERRILWAGLALVSLAVLATQFATLPAHVRFFDNVHWTVGYATGALLAIRGFQRTRRLDSLFFAIATSSYFVGQILWDVQVAVGWNPFPGPSDIFFWGLGPGLTLAFVSQLRGLPQPTFWAAVLDLTAFAAAALAYTLSLYLPERGESGLLVTVTLVAYPVFLYTALGAGVILTLLRRWRLTPSLGLLLVAILADAIVWSEWNLRTLRGTLGDGILLNFVFSYAAILLGVSVAVWNPREVDRPGTERLYFVVSHTVPVLLALGAGIALQRSPLLSASVAQWVQGCSLLIVMATLGRQTLLLAEREQRLAAEQRARAIADQYAEVLVRQHESQRLEALGVLAAGVAHDFNNILMAIRSHVDLARGSRADTPASWEAITRACDRAAEVVRSMLAFGRNPVGGPPRRVDLNAGVEESMRLLTAAIPSSVVFETSLDPETPAILADPAQLQQVLLNLTTNGAHAIGGASGHIAIRTGLRPLDADNRYRLAPGVYAQLQVEDTGRGMDEATRRRIFEPFFTTKGPDEGSGMGLAVVHGIVSGAGGVIECESGPGLGARFTILWPAAGEAEKQTPSPAPAPSGGSGVSLLEGVEILVVDDDEAIAGPVSRYLGKRGALVTECHNPLEALELVRADPRRFRALVCDFTMPEMRGDELCSAILEIVPRMRIVLSSGTEMALPPDPSNRIRMLLKPYPLAELVSLLAALLREDEPPDPA